MTTDLKLMTVAEVAAHSGESTKTWRSRIARRELSHIRLGQSIRITEEAYLSYLERKAVPAASIATSLVNAG